MMRASLFRRSPFLMLAVALLALAVLFAPGPQPAAAQQQETVFHYSATLNPKSVDGALGCDNSKSRNKKCNTEATLSGNDFSFGGSDFTIIRMVLESDGDLIIDLGESFTSLSSEASVSNLTLRAGREREVNGERTFEVKSFPFRTVWMTTGGKVIVPNTNIQNSRLVWSNTGMTWQAGDTVYLVLHSSRDFDTLTFGGATVAEQSYTAGNEISLLDLSEAEKEALRLPMAMGGSYTHTYTATGLPAGLYLGGDSIIRGTPLEATTEPVEVNYSATDENNETVRLVFLVTVAPAVEFAADDITALFDTYMEYTIGQTGSINETLPAATGGDGELTYHLVLQSRLPLVA